YSAAKFDLTLSMDDTAADLRGSMSYATSLFEAASIAAYIATYEQILKQISAKQSITIKELSYVNPVRYDQQIIKWNATVQPYPKEKTLQRLFEEQVERTPDNVAVIYGDKRLSYHSLNARSNRLAHFLISEHGIQPDDLVALCLDRSEEMLVGILGVLKAGGAYVPLDPGYPEDRLAYMLSDTKASV